MKEDLESPPRVSSTKASSPNVAVVRGEGFVDRLLENIGLKKESGGTA